MPFGVALSLDEPTDQAVRRIWQALADRGISSSMIESGYPPHATMAVWDSPDAERIASQISLITVQTPPLNAVLESIGFFVSGEGALYLAPTVTEPLLDLHGRVCAALTEAGANVREYYLPGRWVPHCTLAIGIAPEKVSAAIAVYSEYSILSSGNFTHVTIGRFPPGQRLYTFPLTGA